MAEFPEFPQDSEDLERLKQSCFVTMRPSFFLIKRPLDPSHDQHSPRFHGSWGHGKSQFETKPCHIVGLSPHCFEHQMAGFTPAAGQCPQLASPHHGRWNNTSWQIGGFSRIQISESHNINPYLSTQIDHSNPGRLCLLGTRSTLGQVFQCGPGFFSGSCAASGGRGILVFGCSLSVDFEDFWSDV